MPHQTPTLNGADLHVSTKESKSLIRKSLKDNTKAVQPRSSDSRQKSQLSTTVPVRENSMINGLQRLSRSFKETRSRLQSKSLDIALGHNGGDLRLENSGSAICDSKCNNLEPTTLIIDPRSKEETEIAKTTATSSEFTTKSVTVASKAGGSISQVGRDGAQTQIQKILAIHSRLEGMTCLKPRLEINELFGELVGICVQNLPAAVNEKIMRDPRILELLPSIRAIASIGESHLESHWASLIITSGPSKPAQPVPIRRDTCDSNCSSIDMSAPSSPSPHVSPNSSSTSLSSQAELPAAEDETFAFLQTFPYYQNYIDLARMELSAILPLLPVGGKINKIAFIGSGPLPLTSLCLSHLLSSQLSTPSLSNIDSKRSKTTQPKTEQGTQSLEILNIDSSSTAITQSSTLCTRLGRHAQGMNFAHEQAGSPTRDLKPYDVVFLAALVGSTQADKEEVLLDIVKTMRKGALVVVRTSHGLRRILYPEFEFATERVLGVLDVEVVVHPFSHVVNSIVVARVR